MRRGVFYIPLVLAAALVAVLVLSGGKDYYHAKVLLDNAGGLRSGSPVVIGGVPVGKIELSIDPKTKKVLAQMNIEQRFAPIGKDASAEIVAQNLLGQKQLSVEPGTLSDPAPSGSEIPADRVQTQADLDQVLNVLDAPTRARLAIFVNEAGSAFVGRREDFNHLLGVLSPVLGSGRQLLSELDADNAAIGRLVDSADAYVSTTTAQRAELVALLDRVGQTSETVAARRAELRETLAAAPPALRTLRSFLGRLNQATVPLGPAADKLAATAGPLLAVQEALPAFTGAAAPTLRTAADVAPDLTRLAHGATPTLRAAVPALAQVRRTATDDLPRVADTLDGSVENIVAVIENWSRAIQYRDGLSHIFRGEASFGANVITSAVNRLVPGAVPVRRRARSQGGAGKAPVRPARPAGDPSQPDLPQGTLLSTTLDLLGQTTKDLGDTVKQTTAGLQGALDTGKANTQSLLDYLLKP